ncbi:MAG: prephenate dehydrogenase [Alphaproteobacteria bacterium]|nr:prephenate dehydrogenase [Alphaproteobacteria bacterium]
MIPVRRSSFGLIGVGAFGALAARHLAAHFDLVLHDDIVDTAVLARDTGARGGSLSDAAACDIVMLAVPVQKIADVARDIAPLLRPGALVVDVGSVKIKPVAQMLEILPPHIAVVGTHPLFGPQSGKNGIAGLNIAVCEGRGGRAGEVARFCADALGLRVFEVTPEDHDRQMGYVQALTHLLAKVVVALDLPDMQLTTRTYELMQQMVDMVRYDSDELFRAIERENPFTEQAKKNFFAAARALEDRLASGG